MFYFGDTETNSFNEDHLRWYFTLFTFSKGNVTR